ncbi:hypothetical protein MLD38_032820 [Melastoma candidum]|uniref:Uncharacterized protein n=1 Tax=Melastoma candidum TaxID=119954 RepID=A0ACB9M933_9MYRT|nr:hypothetical protein MLD38_032820 [Melastoma candidum]
MAKARKKSAEDNGATASSVKGGGLVRHQKLSLSIDLPSRRISGYTELEIAVPDIGIVGLHAENLGIVNVSVDGELTEFEYYPQNHSVDSERRFSSVTSAASAADIAGSLYLSALDKELVPNLLINCCKGFKVDSELQEQSAVDNSSHSSGETKQNVKLVRIEFWVDKIASGIHLQSNVLHTDNQIRRARCWFPCIDDNSQRCCFDLEFTVAVDLVAVSPGKLLHQVLSKGDPPRKTYVYKLDVPVSASWISLVVAPFQILPDPRNGLISHMCLSTNISKLQNTVGFFYSAYSHYEEYLGAKFPYGTYKQVFIAPEMAVSSMSIGASMSIFSSDILYDEKIIDKTIDTRIKLAHALARQWFGIYITSAGPEDEWLLDGLAGFLTDSFIKKHLGNNEARYRRFKANCAVCKLDNSGATILGSTSCKDLYGTQSIGLYGKIRSWKAVAILQMLEKQMGPESFCKILQAIISRSLDPSQISKTLSTKEFRHFANKVGNLERPFLKEFFPRWVGSSGCPVLRMGFTYNKRKNIVELAVWRGSTARLDGDALVNVNVDSEARDADVGWPGMMSIRVNELDGMYDHPILPMSGDCWQLLEIQCHSKLAARRFQKPKKGQKADGSDDNADVVQDTRSSSDSPLLWIRADPEMEYLAEVHFSQPVQMWINQLEKDKDVFAQAQSVAALEALPQISFSVVNALSNLLADAKAFWRVRIDAAFALAYTASEETDWSGLHQLIKFYKGRRFDDTIGLPKANDFHDIPEYFVLEAIPHAVAMVRAVDGKSPREAVEFVLQLLKYNDNNGNIYSDVFWLATLVMSVGELEFGQQTILFLSSLLKRIDRLLQFDRLIPSYNGILSVSCISTLARIALKLSAVIPLGRVFELIKPFRSTSSIWTVRLEASRALLDLELQYSGLDAALQLFTKYLEEEPSLKGQTKLGKHALRLCQIRGVGNSHDDVSIATLSVLLRLLDGPMSFNNVFLRHYLFCILQVFAKRMPTLYGVPRDKIYHVGDAETGDEHRSLFEAFVPSGEQLGLERPIDVDNPLDDDVVILNGPAEVHNELVVLDASNKGDDDDLAILEPPQIEVDADVPVILPVPEEAEILVIPEVIEEKQNLVAVPEPIKEIENPDIPEVPKEMNIPPVPPVRKEADTVSSNHERRMPVLKIKVKHSAAYSRGDETANQSVDKTHVAVNGPECAASSSVSVDAPQRNLNQNLEEVNSCHDPGSRVTASIGSAKLACEGDDTGKDLQCTADSSKIDKKFASLQSLSNLDDGRRGSTKEAALQGIEKEEKNGKDKKRRREESKGGGHRDDPKYLERKRLKKEKRRMEKMSKLLNMEGNTVSVTMPTTNTKSEEDVVRQPDINPATAQMVANEVPSTINKVAPTSVDARVEPVQPTPTPRFRIKIKNRTLD